jgi:HAD superfamily hydrolase (TIGR01549 family)
MNTDIRAIYLDLGGTFRIIEENKAYADAAKKKIAQLCGITAPDPVAYFDTVTDKRYDLYREWALRFMAEAPEEVLWSRWLAYDCPRELVERNAAELTYQYRQTKGIRTVVPGGAETVQELCRRGYTLGIISDLVGKHEVDEWLDHDGLRPYFKTVQQSSVSYIRKPNPAIYYYALDEVGIPAEQSCFVGDNLNRDIVGAKACRFGMTVTVHYDPSKPLKLTEENRPDAKVFDFRQLLDIFPGVGRVNTERLIPPTASKS